MRARRGMLLGVAALVAALLAPGTASAGLEWRDGGAAAPATVTFEAVVRTPDAVVAVGREDTTTGPVPAIYRLSDGVWHRDAIAGAPTDARLFDVSANAKGIWAVGSRGTQPLVVHLPPRPADGSADPTTLADGSREWALATGGGAAPLLSLSLTDAGGYAGDTTGKLWPVAGTAGPEVTVARTVATNEPRPVAVNGVALTGDGTGLAVTDGTMTDDRIFAVAGGNSTSQTTVPETAGQNLLAVDARSATDALAIDRQTYWAPGGTADAWERRTLANVGADGRLADVDLGPGVSAIAGAVGGDGYVWHRGSGAWVRDKVATGAALNGVAAVGIEDIWAVGQNGTVSHYQAWPDPPLPPTPTCTTNCSGSSSGSGSGTGPTTTTTSSGTTITTIPPTKPGDPTIYVVEPGPRPRPGQRPRPRYRALLDRVAVVRRPRALIVSFRLRAAARVSIAAKRGRATVARARSRAMRAGRRRVVLRFAGRPPTALRIVVTPLRARRAGTGTRGGSAGA